jgi:hypothetical protein
MPNESAFILKQWPGIKREVKPSDLQNFSLHYRKDIPVTLAKAPPWEAEVEDETQHDE